MARRFWKNDGGRFSAHLRSDSRIEIRIDNKPWNQSSGLKSQFVFHKDKARMGLEMLDEIEKYIDTEGEWPDWNGKKNIGTKSMVYSLEKFGHDWQRSTGYIQMKGKVNGLNYTFSFGTLKALAFYCCAVEIEAIVD